MSCAIIINSCDKYFDLLENNIYLFNKFWSNCSYKVYLNSESKKFVSPNFEISQVFHESGEPWGKRLIDTLKQVDEEFVILLLDDFYIESSVNTQMIEEYISIMQNYPNIASICFDQMPFPNYDGIWFNNLEKRKKLGKYKFSLQAGIWRRDYLLKNIRPSYSPWDFEIIGNVRSYFDKYDFYCLAKNVKRPIDYNHGRLVIQGAFCREEVSKFENEFQLNFQKVRPIIAYKETSQQLGVIDRIKRKLVILYKQIFELIICITERML